MASAKSAAFPAYDQEIAHVAAAMAHPARLAILHLMADRRRRLSGEITAALPLARTTVSQHLVALRKSGLLSAEAQGLTVSYWLNPEVAPKALRRLACYSAALVHCPVCKQSVACGCFKDGRRR